MNRLDSKRTNAIRRKHRVRKTLKSVSTLPRLSVFISNRNVSAQIIDDAANKTIISVTTTGTDAKGTMADKAVMVGKELAKKSKAKKITKVTLDRGNKLYHGRIKALADAAREEGLEI
ncbi:MAG TPA: 50S ribosomal protein L18 [Candidatus Saccharimonadales bacterium]|nr:50S ribosomal protein L18 [Candidatus Saccharimonadales bacterium]